ncbi:TPA: hypothetical protein DCR49_03690 [Candidatus Delongbacteria bacterium]|nr:hypothetical protein [Candidatus Delongbacteria bacterium]
MIQTKLILVDGITGSGKSTRVQDKCPFCSGKANISQLDEKFPYKIKCYNGCGTIRSDKLDYSADITELRLKWIIAYNKNLNFNDIMNCINSDILNELFSEHELILKTVTGFSLTDPEIENAGGCDSLDPLYLIKSGEDKYSLRLYDSRRDPSSIMAELFWLDTLIENNIPVGETITDSKGNKLHLIEDTGRYCVMRRWIDGKPLYNALKTNNPDDLAEMLGDLMAKMHKISEELILSDDLSVEKRDFSYYESLFNEYKQYEFDSDDQKNSFIRSGEEFLKMLAENGHDQSSYGIIHGDITFRNLLYHDSKLIPIDFMSVRHDHFLTDIVQLFHCDLTEENREAFWNSYKKIRPIPDNWQILLPVFLSARAAGLSKVRTFL